MRKIIVIGVIFVLAVFASSSVSNLQAADKLVENYEFNMASVQASANVANMKDEAGIRFLICGWPDCYYYYNAITHQHCWTCAMLKGLYPNGCPGCGRYDFLCSWEGPCGGIE